MYFLIGICLILFSCKRHSVDLENIELRKDYGISQSGDSIFFSGIRSIFFDKYLYMSNYRMNQILVLDEMGHLICTLGSEGRGPGEFVGVSHIYVSNDTIYALNEGKRCIEVYNIDGYIKTVPLYEAGIRLRNTGRFVILHNKFYFPYVTNENSIVEYNLLYESTRYFGLLDRFQTEDHTRFRNERHLLAMNEKYLIAVSHVKPVIEKYNLNGEFIAQLSYENIYPVQKRLEFVNRQKSEINSVFSVVSDAYVYSNKLYLIIVSNEDEKVSSNKVLEIEIDDKMKVLRLYDLGDGWYSSICVTANNLWAFDTKSDSLKKIPLKTNLD